MIEESGEDFVTMAMNFIQRWKNSNIMIIVEHELGGIETLRTNGSVAWTLGILQIAKQMFINSIEENRNREIEKKMHEEAQAELSSIGKSEKGKAN